ncbi:ABC transporter permease (plasmid) [Skermanella rosea]|uniref:ABC transporter permease n=1 Tax=Skermanella rosea TaxID=1817965 RepID=UPI001E63A07A|nr:ABC transporter permease [Skermanella rosea]UEM07500.1 ABC transporter permease [Skermanella rosea]
MTMTASRIQASAKALPGRAWSRFSLGEAGGGFARAGIQVLAVAAFFAAWEIGVRTGAISGFLVGQPSGIFANFGRFIADGSLFVDAGYTALEAIVGFAIGTLLGTTLGLSLWYSENVARIVEPFVIALNSVPKIALAPLIILWFGTGYSAKIALVIAMTAIVALITAYQAARDSDKDLQRLLASMGADKHRIFYKAVIPSSLPAVIATFRINIGFALVGAVVGEFISSQHGLGHLVFTASNLYDLNTVWVGLFSLMILGFALYHLVNFVERRVLPWKQEQTSRQVAA